MEFDAETAYSECVEQTADFVHSAGFEQVVIGLSGGVDSSLVCTIAVDALGRENVHGIMLPGPYSSESSLTDARELAQNLGVHAELVSITEPYLAFKHSIESATDMELSGLASENTQARCRMVVLMAASNANDWLMLNTGNLSEAAMGYSTLYGDTAGAFAPIGGLLKTQVYELCRWRSRHAKARGEIAPIPENVLTKAPSAELAPGQSDEASLGVDYATLDEILQLLIIEDMTEDEIAAHGFSPQLVGSIASRYRKSEFKRAMEPPFAKI